MIGKKNMGIYYKMSIKNTEAIEKLFYNLLNFLKSVPDFPPELFSYHEIGVSWPLETKIAFIITTLKPAQNNMADYIDYELRKHGRKRNEFKPEDFQKYCRYLEALTHCV